MAQGLLINHLQSLPAPVPASPRTFLHTQPEFDTVAPRAKKLRVNQQGPLQSVRGLTPKSTSNGAQQIEIKWDLGPTDRPTSIEDVLRAAA